ncbi:MAG TPA: DUF6789 family protein [Mariprofundaceae bacterium]|nr:DUF6789 family protein [Mariprofundaceae bacterium]
MNKLSNGILAGLAATIVLSMLMVMKAKMGLMPDVNVIAMLAGKMGGSAAMGWAAHFMIGVIGYGLAYALVFSDLPFGNHTTCGIALGITGWLVMMVAVMPMMGAGLFGLALPSGMMVPVATLMLHVIFGAVLGYVYGLTQRSGEPVATAG